MFALPSASTCSTFCKNKCSQCFSFHNSVSYVGSHEPTEEEDKSITFQSLLARFLLIAAETLFPLSSSRNIKAAARFLPLFHVTICGREMGIRFVPPPLRLKPVFLNPITCSSQV